MQSIPALRWQTVSKGIFVCSITLLSVTGVVIATPAGVVVADTSVSNAEPEIGDTITITPTVRYASDESGSFEVRQVTVTDTNGTRYGQVRDIGVLGSGDAVDIPLQATFDTEGNKHLTVHVRGTQYTENDTVRRLTHRKYPVYVTVSEPSTSPQIRPQLSIVPQSAVVGTETTVNVTVSNGADSTISNVSLQLAGSGNQITAQTQVQPAIHARNSSTFQFHIQPSTTGTQTLTATLRYDDDEHIVANETLTVASARDDASVYATTSVRNGSTVLQYRVANHGNRQLSDVAVTGGTANTTLPTATIDRIPPATTETMTTTVNGQPVGTATITATYTSGTTTNQIERTVEFQTSPTHTANETSGGDSSPPPNGSPALGPGMFIVSGIATAGAAIGYRNWSQKL